MVAEDEGRFEDAEEPGQFEDADDAVTDAQPPRQ